MSIIPENINLKASGGAKLTIEVSDRSIVQVVAGAVASATAILLLKKIFA